MTNYRIPVNGKALPKSKEVGVNGYQEICEDCLLSQDTFT